MAAVPDVLALLSAGVTFDRKRFARDINLVAPKARGALLAARAPEWCVE